MVDMVDAPANGRAPRRWKWPLLLGLVLAIVGGAGGFLVVRGGFIGSDPTEIAETMVNPLDPVAFVALDPLIINMPGQGGTQMLRFVAHLDVPPEYLAEVELIRPRIMDVLNSYLRAVETSDLEDPSALTTLRAHMLRRVQVVSGAGRVRDLLITEFVMT